MNQHDACDEYITELINHIHNLQDQIDDLRKENTSWRMWMARTTEIVKNLQN